MKKFHSLLKQFTSRTKVHMRTYMNEGVYTPYECARHNREILRKECCKDSELAFRFSGVFSFEKKKKGLPRVCVRVSLSSLNRHEGNKIICKSMSPSECFFFFFFFLCRISSDFLWKLERHDSVHSLNFSNSLIFNGRNVFNFS